MDRIVEEIAMAAKRRNPRDPVRRFFLADEGTSPTSFLSRVAGVLRDVSRSVIHFDLPSGRFDAGEHLLGQLCQELDTDQLPHVSFSPNHPIHKRVAWISHHFGLRVGAPFLLLTYSPQHLATPGLGYEPLAARYFAKYPGGAPRPHGL
jgi:hypothetical protein